MADQADNREQGEIQARGMPVESEGSSMGSASSSTERAQSTAKLLHLTVELLGSAEEGELLPKLQDLLDSARIDAPPAGWLPRELSSLGQSVCTHVFSKGDLAWNCRTCQVDEYAASPQP
ncbi:hypothetical protein T492DRAFT_455520 [Pavlovales sp. CCMP2436]|nr:hypothetical protein T492DRAFT_455520 [Pavlovales sp. CCMP2436]